MGFVFVKCPSCHGRGFYMVTMYWETDSNGQPRPGEREERHCHRCDGRGTIFGLITAEGGEDGEISLAHAKELEGPQITGGDGGDHGTLERLDPPAPGSVPDV